MYKSNTTYNILVLAGSTVSQTLHFDANATYCIDYALALV